MAEEHHHHHHHHHHSDKKDFASFFKGNSLRRIERNKMIEKYIKRFLIVVAIIMALAVIAVYKIL